MPPEDIRNFDGGSSGKRTLEKRASRFFEDFDGFYQPFAPPPPPLLQHRSSSNLSRGSFDSAREFVHCRVGCPADKPWHGSKSSLSLSRDDAIGPVSQQRTGISAADEGRSSMNCGSTAGGAVKNNEMADMAQTEEEKAASQQRSAHFVQWVRRPWRSSHGAGKGYIHCSDEGGSTSSSALKRSD